MLGETDKQGRFTIQQDCHELLKVIVSPLEKEHLYAEKPFRSLRQAVTNTILVTKTKKEGDLVKFTEGHIEIYHQP